MNLLHVFPEAAVVVAADKVRVVDRIAHGVVGVIGPVGGQAHLGDVPGGVQLGLDVVGHVLGVVLDNLLVAGELVADGPGENGGVVKVPLDHLLVPQGGAVGVLAARRVLDLGHTAAAPQVALADEEEAHLVAVVQQVFAHGHVAEPGGVHTHALHVVDVTHDDVVGLGLAVGPVVPYPVGAGEADSLAIEVELGVLNLNLADADVVLSGVKDGVAVHEPGLDGVQVGGLKVPQLHILQGEDGAVKPLVVVPGGGLDGHFGGLGAHQLAGGSVVHVADHGISFVRVSLVVDLILEGDVGSAIVQIRLRDNVLPLQLGGVVHPQQGITRNAAPLPPCAVGELVVHLDGNGVLAAVVQVGVHPELEGGVAAVVAAHLTAVDPDAAVMVHGSQVQIGGVALILSGHVKGAAVPAGALVVGVVVLQVPVAGHGESIPALRVLQGVPPLGLAHIVRVSGKGPQAVEGQLHRHPHILFQGRRQGSGGQLHREGLADHRLGYAVSAGAHAGHLGGIGAAGQVGGAGPGSIRHRDGDGAHGLLTGLDGHSDGRATLSGTGNGHGHGGDGLQGNSHGDSRAAHRAHRQVVKADPAAPDTEAHAGGGCLGAVIGIGVVDDLSAVHIAEDMSPLSGGGEGIGGSGLPVKGGLGQLGHGTAGILIELGILAVHVAGVNTEVEKVLLSGGTEEQSGAGAILHVDGVHRHLGGDNIVAPCHALRSAQAQGASAVLRPQHTVFHGVAPRVGPGGNGRRVLKPVLIQGLPCLRSGSSCRHSAQPAGRHGHGQQPAEHAFLPC